MIWFTLLERCYPKWQSCAMNHIKGPYARIWKLQHAFLQERYAFGVLTCLFRSFVYHQKPVGACRTFLVCWIGPQATASSYRFSQGSPPIPKKRHFLAFLSSKLPAFKAIGWYTGPPVSFVLTRFLSHHRSADTFPPT